MLLWLTPVVLLGARILWQRRPGFGTCALFWALALLSVLLSWTADPSQLGFIGGILCNGLVTLANGGFMPVAAHRRLQGSARSLWVQRETGQRFLFLADNFGTRFIRFSIGDVILLIGLGLAFAGY